MSRYSYAGNFENPAADWSVREITDGPDTGKFLIIVNTHDEQMPERAHTMHGDNANQNLFTDADEAWEWIEGTSQAFEEDYEQYLEENHDELARMDEYEQWRNEY